MVAPWVGAAVVLRPASTATAVPSTAWDDHSRWIREMNQEYARRLSLAKTSSADPGSGSGRSTDTGYEEDTGFEEVLDDEMHVYRNIELGGRPAALRTSSERRAALHCSRSATRLPSGPRTPRWTRSGSGATPQCCGARPLLVLERRGTVALRELLQLVCLSLWSAHCGSGAGRRRRRRRAGVWLGLVWCRVLWRNGGSLHPNFARDTLFTLRIWILV